MLSSISHPTEICKLNPRWTASLQVYCLLPMYPSISNTHTTSWTDRKLIKHNTYTIGWDMSEHGVLLLSSEWYMLYCGQNIACLERMLTQYIPHTWFVHGCVSCAAGPFMSTTQHNLHPRQIDYAVDICTPYSSSKADGGQIYKTNSKENNW